MATTSAIAEQPLRQQIQIVPAHREGVGPRLEVPDVRDLAFLQRSVERLVGVQQGVLITAGHQQQADLLARVGGAGQIALAEDRGGEAADPPNRVEVGQADVERLSAAH